MSDNKNDQVIVAFFDSKEAAEFATSALNNWDEANQEIKLGAIGTITKENGKVKTHIGRKVGKGATVGTVIGIIAAILSGGVTLLGGVLAGGVTGGVVGAFLKKSTHLTKEEIEQIGTELDSGRVALVVTCDEDEIAPTREQLINVGGQVRNYTIPQEAISDAAQAVPNAEPSAVEQTPAEVVSAALEETTEQVTEEATDSTSQESNDAA